MLTAIFSNLAPALCTTWNRKFIPPREINKTNYVVDYAKLKHFHLRNVVKAY